MGEGGSWASAFTHLNALLGREEGVGPPLLQEGDGHPLTQVQAVLTGGIRASRHRVYGGKSVKEHFSALPILLGK